MNTAGRRGKGQSGGLISGMEAENCGSAFKDDSLSPRIHVPCLGPQ